MLTLVLLSSITFFLGLGRQAITDSDEAFYAEAAREMVEGGDWLTPHFNYQERWQKPILYYWLTAATYLATGATEWAARLWSAISAVGLVLLTWVVARRTTGRDEAAWLAGAIAATGYGYFAMARLALPDLPLAFCITLTIWTALQQQWRMAAVAAALGFLLKGPVALAVPAVVLLPVWWREGVLFPLPLRRLAAALGLFTIIAVPWYGAMTIVHGSAYLDSFFIGDNIERFVTDRFNEPRAPWFYVPIVIGGMLPWAPYFLVLPWRGAVDVVRRRRRLADDEWRLLLWALAPLLLFTLSIGKQPRYILPILPPLAILLAHSLASHIRDANPEASRSLVAATWLTAALHVVLAALLFRARELFITVSPWLTSLAVGLLVVSAATFGEVVLSRRWRLLPATATATSAAFLLSLQFGALAGIRPEPVEQMAALVRAHRMAAEPVGEYQVFVRNLVFYLRFRQVDLFDEGRALDFLNSPERVLLVVRAADLPRLEAISGITARQLGEVQYLDTANIRLRTLLSPIPNQDLERILLVTNR